MSSVLRPRAYKLAPWQMVSSYSPYEHFAMFGGVGVGKSFTGSMFSIRHLVRYPDLTGFIGANSYDQLTQASLRELFIHLEAYGLPYVYNKQPPDRWKIRGRMPSYQNILSVKVGNKIAHAFVRVTSEPNALRGIQFSWYWLDETRDTPQDTHDVVLSRMRESRYRKGLITTTTNGEDWGYRRFARAHRGQHLYGSLHVKTYEAVKAGILTEAYYQTMLASYSELMIAQELEAMHVNVHGGMAYYASSMANRRHRAPWGNRYPDPSRPLIVGCDFNYDPAPHIWMVGQTDTERKRIHWFGEIAKTRASTPEMTMALLLRYPGFYYRVFGDRSGARATTSNAGKPDYDQMAQIFSDHDCSFSIDSDQTNNPLVRNRVENMNRMCKNGLGEHNMTWDPEFCPELDSDMKSVGWKQNTQTGKGKLSDGGDKRRTHASDGAGYAVWKIFPPGSRGRIIPGVASFAASTLGPRN